MAILAAARRRRALGSMIAGLLALACAVPGNAAAPKLRVGIEHVPPAPGPTDFRLYTPEHLDTVLAELLANELGREVELVAVGNSDGGQALDAGQVDLVLGRVVAGDPAGRGAIPVGYRSGQAAAMRSDTDIRDWPDLAGRTVCVGEGNPESLQLAERNHAVVRLEAAPARALVLVRTGVCDAALHDRALLAELFRQEAWRKFSATLPESEPAQLTALLPEAGPLAGEIRRALTRIDTPERWAALESRWARNVALEVYLDQDAPDCH